MGTEPAGNRDKLCADTIERIQFRRPGARAFLHVEAAATHATVFCNGLRVGEHLGAWTPFEFELTQYLLDDNEVEIHCEDRMHVTNGFLPVLGVRWTGVRGASVSAHPAAERPPARQRSATRGTQLLVDGRPFRVRGILHWGYYPELGTPWPGDEVIRSEIRELQALGFNLIKFCLWIPPRRYLELCDELGMFAWIEYPVWDRPLAGRGLIAEYEEFFRFDGPHPCVILRTLTCENDRVDPELARELIDRAHRMIPGCLILDNSAWLCKETVGDFHDEHPYLHNAQWQYLGRRLRDRITKPLLLGETIIADSDPEGDARVALAVRRYQIEKLAADLPDAGYVVNAIRDTFNAPLGLYTPDGRAKYKPEDWAWHGDTLSPPRAIAPAAGPIIGPRKGEWKCPEFTYWSPVFRVLDESLPRDLVLREGAFDLLSGRVLSHADGTRVLIEVHDYHGHSTVRAHPLVIEFQTHGEWRIVSALRHDTPAGRELWQALTARIGRAGLAPPPQIGPLAGSSLVFEDWEMALGPPPGVGARPPFAATVHEAVGTSADSRRWERVKCDTPLVNHGRNVFEGWASFRTRFEHPGGRRTLRMEAVGDYYEVYLDGRRLAEFGPRDGTWDGTRDVPRELSVELAAGAHELVFHVRDWRSAGGLIGPVFLATDLSERIF